MGTSQIGNPRVTGGDENPEISTSPQINNAFHQSDEVIVDIDTSSQAENEEGMALYYLPEGQTIEDVLSDSTIKLVRKTLETIVPKVPLYKKHPGYENKIYGYLLRYKPVLMAYQIGRIPIAEYTYNQSPPHKICLKAKENGKKIIGLETYEELLSHLDVLTKDEQEEFVVGCCHGMMNQEVPGERTEQVLELYLRGGISKIKELASKDVKDSEKYLSKKIIDKLKESTQYKRNDLLTEKTKLILKKELGKSFFIAISYGSVIDDENGLLKQLREAGYTIKWVGGESE